MRQNILDPLGLEDTTPELPVEHRGGRFATGYSGVRREGEREPLGFYQVRGIAPAAGYASSVLDLAKFASWQFRLLETEREEVLKARTLREMQRVHWVCARARAPAAWIGRRLDELALARFHNTIAGQRIEQHLAITH